jgi:inward rectifier potassium channel
MQQNKQKRLLTEEEIYDLGFGTRETPKGKRIINKDGSFNVLRKGIPFNEFFNFYHYLVSISWTKFILIVFSGYILINILFALIYYLIGTEHLIGIMANNEFEKFMEDFFFSAQSFTTVGYGRISPQGFLTSTVASLEALFGLLSLAIATGLIYGRFSRPVAKIAYSKNAVIAPFKNITGFMFRVANKQMSQMVDVEVRVMYSCLENGVRKFYGLKLEYKTITFFPSIWTVNHPIDEESPLNGKNEEDLIKEEAEFLILLKGFDDTFSTNVHSRYSYNANEIVWGVKFSNIFGTDGNGMGTVAVNRISDYEKVK